MENYINTIINDDCNAVLKSMPENVIDTVITDPPYGFKFMGKKWDYEIPSIETFQNILRVCKPGAFLFCFGGPRTFHRLTCNIEDAGWNIVDVMSWLFGSGVPKGVNIQKHLEKRGYENHHEWDEYNTSLKPAWEPIIVARKDIYSNYAENAIEYGVSGLNIKDCRVKSYDAVPQFDYVGECSNRETYGSTKKSSKRKKYNEAYSNRGRYPANLMLSHHPDCEFEGYKEIKGKKGYPNGPGGCASKEYRESGKGSKTIKYQGHDDNTPWIGHADENGLVKIEKWDCHDDCPIKMMNDQTGIKKSGNIEAHHKSKDYSYRNSNTFKKSAGLLNKNKEVQYTTEDKTEFPSRFFYQPKARKEDYNNHPTIKPLDLIEYLCKLSKSPKGGIVLDPFIGSGTTALACINAERDYIGIELEKEYCEIAERRIKDLRSKKPRRIK